MEVEGEEQQIEMNNNVMCLLTDPEGAPLGAPLYLPQNAGPKELQQMVNKLLNNVSKANPSLQPHFVTKLFVYFFSLLPQLWIGILKYLFMYKYSYTSFLIIILTLFFKSCCFCSQIIG